MFDYDPPKSKEPVDYTGLIIALMLSPVFFVITLLANADMALSACMVLAMIMIAVKIRWYLRKHVWFWVIIAVILALHIPLILMVRWPQEHAPTLFYTMPIGIADFVIILGAVGLGERLFSKGSSSDDQQE
jgi:hypothetical protein